MTVTSAGRSFDAWANEYDRFRPGYPDALFEAIATRLSLPQVFTDGMFEMPYRIDLWITRRSDR